MNHTFQTQIDSCIADLRQGTLTEAKLRSVLEGRKSIQSILYLQLQNTHPGSAAIGYTLILEGKVVDPPRDPNAWPYKSVLDAVRDGWRIISFPNLALIMDPVTPATLGCEFILEKWSA
jgi:hypothetical protein